MVSGCISHVFAIYGCGHYFVYFSVVATETVE